MNRKLASAFAFAVALTFVGLDAHAMKIKDVKVVNPPGQPVPVIVEGAVPVTVDEPLSVDADAVREPFHFDGFIIRETSTDPFQVSLFDVPTDRTLVIETISIAAFNAQINGPTLLAERGGPVFASPALVQNGATNSYSALHEVRIRVGAGATIDGIVNALGRFRFMISGYLLPTVD